MDHSPLSTLSFHGPWSTATRQHRTLRFLEAYTNMVKRCDFSGASDSWYAPTAIFINADGEVYTGGETIWRWMGEGVFAPFARIGEIERSRKILLVQGGGSERIDQKGNEMGAGKVTDLVVYEHEIFFWPKGGGEGEEMIARRMMEFVVGKGEEGAGVEGAQILQGKVWWDMTGLLKEIEAKETM